MIMTKILNIDNAVVIDPQHEEMFNKRTIRIEDGIITADRTPGTTDASIDAGGRITVAGGIYPSYQVPLLGNAFTSGALANAEKSLIQAGYTTIIGEGFTPFSALDAHLSFMKLKHVNKIPLLDVGNFQPMVNYLKNGITNYAVELSAMLLENFKAFGFSCLNPGVVSLWNEHSKEQFDFKKKLPFIGTSMEKIVQELVVTLKSTNLKSSLFIEVGGLDFNANDAMKGIFKNVEGPTIHEGKKTNPARVVVHNRSRQAAGQGWNDIGDDMGNLFMLVDVPDILEKSMHVEMNPLASSEGTRLIVDGFIEGEMYQRLYYPVVTSVENPHYMRWLSGMQSILQDAPHPRSCIGMSMAPHVFSSPVPIAKLFAFMMSIAARRALLEQPGFETIKKDTLDCLGDGQMQLPDLIYSTRVIPARMTGLEGKLGGLGENQLGDVVVLDVTRETLDGVLQDPAGIVKLFSEPFAVIKSGSVLYKNQLLDGGRTGYTFTQKIEENPALTSTTRGYLDKEFLKFYSTHLDSKVVQDDVVNPAITIQTNRE